MLVSMKELDALPTTVIITPATQPTRIEEGEALLSKRLRHVAAVRLIGKHLPARQDRRRALQAIAGILLRDETPIETVEVLVDRIARVADDAQPEQFRPVARECKRRLEAGEAVAGIPTLQELFGNEVCDAFLRWFGLMPVSQSIGNTDNLDAVCAEMLLNDMGNAQRFVVRHGNDVRYCHSWKCWLAWTGERWAKDETGQVMRWARDTVRAIYNEAASIPVKLDAKGKDTNQGQRDGLARHAHQSGAHVRLEAMVKQAQSFEEVAVVAADLDSNPWLLNVANGTVDLRTGKITAHRREDLQTKQAAVAFDSEAEAAIWHTFLDKVLPSRDVQKYVQRLVGYTLSGVTTEQCLAFLYGTGRNGKSVFTGILEALVGDYWCKTRAETLMLRKNAGAVNNDVAALVGKRLVTVSEVGEGERLNEALVKDLTGNDIITARFLYGEFFTFRPAFKLWMYGNHRPTITGTDTGIWRRIRLIPFLVTIPEGEVDPYLPDKLRSELSGILNWALEGCRKWQQEGISTPKEVKDATQEYRAEMDSLQQFLNDCCTTGENLSVTSAELYRAYRTWCVDNGERQMTQARLGKCLKERGYASSRDSRARGWQGLGLITAEIETMRRVSTSDEITDLNDIAPSVFSALGIRTLDDYCIRN